MDLTVNLKKDPGQSLGIGFKKLAKPPHCQVFKMVDNGVATGLIHKGDLLLSINGLNVQHLCPAEIGGVLERFNNNPSLVLEVRRSLTNGNLNSSKSDLVQNGHPVIEVEPTSPDSISMDSDSPSPSKDMFSTTGVRGGVLGQRTRRTMFMESKALPLIEEGSDHNKCNGMQLLTTGGHPAVSQRHSFTPEAIRKPLEELRRTKMRSCKSLDLGVLPQWRTGNMHGITIHNLLDGNELTDRLYSKRIPEYHDTGCSDQVCKGSHMQLKPKRPYATPRSTEDVFPLAKDFMAQYFDSKKVALGHDYENKLSVRVWQIQQEIEATGTYNLTYEELVFGARTAWRNAPRCVNRIVWRQLEVLDARDVTNPKEMFDAICHHIKYANNGGNLRSTITVFPHRTRKNCDFRVWNSQMIQYAGYKNPDKSILGDPANVEFTEMCMEHLDWSPPSQRTEFDILPIVLQANGGDPELFEVPSELVIEAEISHPEYDWFKDLGLRWYGLPAVSSMLLDCGGLEFPGIPFNGWYMGTEIARDLGDSNRYNKLKPIAQRMGLNMQTCKLWKDKAIVELNIAVLHSFQSSNISVADHHSTTESFITHMKSEMIVRGGCPADWVWIVPPISGSITPVFHQEMNMYHLSPSYDYQHVPWKYHNWTTTDGRKKSGTFVGPHRFKRLAKLVGINALMYRKVYQKRIKATILFATETGRARNYANVVKDVFGRVFASKVCCMEEYDKTNMEHEQILIVVSSTFGSGDPPANGESFGRYILDLRNGSIASQGSQAAPTPRSHRMSTIVAPTPAMLDTSNKSVDRLLTQVKYAVFGLGSRAYPNFCTFAHTCDTLLKDLGAEMIQPCGEGDELCGQEESFQAWLQQCYHRACQLYSIDPERTEDDLEGYKSGYNKENFRIQAYLKPEEGRSDLCSRLKTVHSKNIQPFIIKARSKLQSATSDRSTILVALSTNSNSVHYEPGDHIAIYPQNSSKLVKQLISVLNPPIDPDEPIYVESRRVSHSKEHWVEEKRMPVPITLRGALTYYLDISNPPSPQFIKLLAQHATRSTEQEELNELAKGGDKYEDWKYGRFPNLCDVFCQFHSLKIDMTLLLQQLPLLQCRYYSISSSPRMYPNEVHITVAVVCFKKRSTGPWHNGVCSTWLNRLEIGSRVPSVIRKSHAFHLPSDPRIPIIMIGPGTGIAPYRSFWQERLHIRNLALKMQLTQPSTPTIDLQPQTISMSKEDHGARRRRKTTYLPPTLSLLQAPSDEVDSPSSNSNLTCANLGTVPMRRSLSDTDKNEEITKMLASKQKSWGNMSLYFGCRRHDLDYIFKDELMKAKVSGALSDVHVAFSREPGRPKIYVQHLLKENADQIVREMMEDRGHIYVCGDISMAADVCRTVQSIFEENAAMSSEEARSLIESLKDRGFYHEDIFGVTLKHNEVTTRVRTAAKKRIMATNPDSIHPMKSPMTPSMRITSPFRFQPTDSISTSNYDSSTGGRSFSKRHIANTLTTSSATTPDARARTIASPETKRIAQSPETRGRKFADSTTSIKPRAKTMLKGSLSIDDAYILPSNSPKQTTTEKPRNTKLEPLNEVTEGQIGGGLHIPSIDVSSPAHSEKEKISSQAASIFPPSTSTSKIEPEMIAVGKTSEEKKKAQRIRTKSKVETVL